VIQIQGRVNVFDVTVPHEDGDYKVLGRQCTLEKYSWLIPKLRMVFGATSGEVLPIVVGTMWAMPRKTVKALTTLGIKTATCC
jgi:hypothetical protein